MAGDEKDPNYNKKTTIEARDPKTLEQQLKELQGKSFAKEIENDKKASAVLIGRAEDAQRARDIKGLGINENHVKQEVESVAIYKRALILAGSADLQVTSTDGKTVNAADNNLPVSSYLSHGSRTLIQIPPGSDDKLINWLTSGDPAKDGRSEAQDPDKAMAEGKYVYNRAAATHDVSVKDGKDGKEGEVKETKGFLIGARDYFSNVFGKKTKHWGVDLAVGAEFGGKDASGKTVAKPDGDHGHLYIHYTPATKDKPGSIMFGMEGAAPYSSKHSKVGGSEPISPTGGSKFGNLDLKKKLANEAEYRDTVIPKKYNGLHAKLDDTAITSITGKKAEEFSIELAEALPKKSPKDFVENVKEAHKTPEYKEPKQPESVSKPNFLKRLANKITVGYAYKDQIADYKEYKKTNKFLTAQQKSNDEKQMSPSKRSKDVSVDIIPTRPSATPKAPSVVSNKGHSI